MAKIHFRPYNPNQTVLFPQRIDEDIADNDPVRMVDAHVILPAVSARTAAFSGFTKSLQNNRKKMPAGYASMAV